MKSRKSLLLSGGVLAASTMAANIINLLFNVFLGRTISIESFGVITLINSFMYFGSIFYNSLLATATHEVASLEDKPGAGEFLYSLTKQILYLSAILSLAWILAVPYLASFFKISDLTILYLFAGVLIFYPLVFLGRGYLQGKLIFVAAGVSIFLEPLLKLISGVLFVFSNPSLAYLSIYLSAVLTALITLILVLKHKPTLKPFKDFKFPLTFFAAALLTGVSTISFLSLDMILVKHFLTPIEAGQYAYLSLIGKIIYFLGSLTNVFILSFFSGNSKKAPAISFNWLLMSSVLLCSFGFLIFGILGSISIPLIFGSNSLAIIPFASPYIIAIGLLTLSGTIVSYHLARKQYIFPLITLIMPVLITLGFYFYHTTITQIVYVLVAISIIYSLIILLAHIRQGFLAPKIKLNSLEDNIYAQN